MTSSGFVTPRGLGARFEINARFARTDPGFVAADDGATRLPTAHFIAARPAEGWIAALGRRSPSAPPPPRTSTRPRRERHQRPPDCHLDQF